MSAQTLSGPYQINRVEVPKFFTPKTARNAHGFVPGETVLTESAAHHKSGWMTMGIVSMQTPLGQGIYAGFHISELRPATNDEVLAALERSHLSGADFLPGCSELQDAGYTMVLNKTFKNWLAQPGLGADQPAVPVTEDAVEAHIRDMLARYSKIINDWGKITRDQIGVIQCALL